jgi:phosphatidylserine/phosphatidylglycerophosphate/cardiolipin synthase-like enzyme
MSEIIPIIEPVFGSEFPKKVIPLIQEAKQSIKIIVFDWRWYPNDIGCTAQIFNREILAAAARGADLRVITNVHDVARVLREQGVKVSRPENKRLIHCKLMIIDEKHLVIGSHNYTQNAFTANHEASVIIRNCPDISKFIYFFNSLFK